MSLAGARRLVSTCFPGSHMSARRVSLDEEGQVRTEELLQVVYERRLGDPHKPLGILVPSLPWGSFCLLHGILQAKDEREVSHGGMEVPVGW